MSARAGRGLLCFLLIASAHVNAQQKGTNVGHQKFPQVAQPNKAERKLKLQFSSQQ